METKKGKIFGIALWVAIIGLISVIFVFSGMVGAVSNEFSEPITDKVNSVVTSRIVTDLDQRPAIDRFILKEKISIAVRKTAHITEFFCSELFSCSDSGCTVREICARRFIRRVHACFLRFLTNIIKLLFRGVTAALKMFWSTFSESFRAYCFALPLSRSFCELKTKKRKRSFPPFEFPRKKIFVFCRLLNENRCFATGDELK